MEMNFARHICQYLRMQGSSVLHKHLFVGNSNPSEGPETYILQVVVTRGLQGSGKSMWSKMLSQHAFQRIDSTKYYPWVRICKDDLRAMMGEYWVKPREEYIDSCVKSMIYGALMEGYCVVFDGLGMSEHVLAMVRQACMDAAKDMWILRNTRTKVELFYKDFKLDIDTCIRNDQLGAKDGYRRLIGAEVIKETSEKYKDVLTTLKSWDSAPYEVCNWSYYKDNETLDGVRWED